MINHCIIELTMHKSEFMHCSSSLLELHQSNLKIGFVLLACCLPGRQLTAVLKIQSPAPWDRGDGRAAAVLLQTCGKWKKPAKLPIENGISKTPTAAETSKLLLTIEKSSWWIETARSKTETRTEGSCSLDLANKNQNRWNLIQSNWVFKPGRTASPYSWRAKKTKLQLMWIQ